MSELEFDTAIDTQATLLLEKTQARPTGPPSDRYHLGFTIKDQEDYSSLSLPERTEFDNELRSLIRIEHFTKAQQKAQASNE